MRALPLCVVCLLALAGCGPEEEERPPFDPFGIDRHIDEQLPDPDVEARAPQPVNPPQDPAVVITFRRTGDDTWELDANADAVNRVFQLDDAQDALAVWIEKQVERTGRKHVLIRGERDVKWKYVVQLLNELSSVGITTNVQFKVIGEDEG